MIAHDNSTLSSPSRPKRELQIDQLIHRINFWNFLYNTIGIKHAGDFEKPRPLPEWTFYDNKKIYQRSIQRFYDKGSTKLPLNTIVFALASHRKAWKPEEIITVPLEDLWWFASASDTVFLSDGITHHYTTIASVDRENERIYFDDAWPELFFLREGLNEEDVRAQIKFNDDSQQKESIRRIWSISISQEEFFRVVVGILTIDTPELIDRYFRYRSEQRENPDFNLRCALTLLDSNLNNLASVAAYYLKKTLDLVSLSKQQIDVSLATSKLFLALNLASFYALKNDDKLLLKPFQEELERLTENFSRKSLLTGLKADELGRLGDLAGHIGNMEAAAEFFNWAIAQDPQHEYVHFLRAKATFYQQQFSTAISDLDTALKLNEENIRQAQRQVEKKDLKGWFEQGVDEGRLARLKELREEEIYLRTIAYLGLGQLETARQNLQLLREINSQNSSIEFISQGIEQMETNPVAAQQDFLQTLKLSHDPNFRAFMNQKRKEIIGIKDEGET